MPNPSARRKAAAKKKGDRANAYVKGKRAMRNFGPTYERKSREFKRLSELPAGTDVSGFYTRNANRPLLGEFRPKGSAQITTRGGGGKRMIR